MVSPRVLSLPVESVPSGLPDEAVDFCRSVGLGLDEFQAFVLRESLKTRADGKWSAFEVGVCVARQNGKDVIQEARELVGLFLIREPLGIHSAHLFDTSLEHHRRLAWRIEDCPELDRQTKRIIRSHGEEGIETIHGSRLRFRTRTKGGGRGFSCDTLYLNEAMAIAEAAHGALLPTLSARPNPQVFYFGSAVDQLIHEYGVVFARVRERGMRGDDPRLAWFDWSVEGESPQELSLETLRDKAAWAQANPALGIRIDLEHVEAELRSMDARTFAVERLGVGDWPRTDHVSETLIDLYVWQELEDAGSVLQDPVHLAFDVSPDRKGCVSAAGRNQDGLWHVETVDNRGGTGWMVARIAELVGKHKPVSVVCDGYGPAASLIPALEDLNVEVTTMDAGDHGQACGRFVDVIAEGGLRHVADEPLLQAIRAAKTRPLGDAWAWSRKNSTGHIAPLVAATLALSAAMTTKPVKVSMAWG